jgi:hypothetical protein
MEDDNFEVENETIDTMEDEDINRDFEAEVEDEDFEVENETGNMIDAIYDGNLRVAGEVFSDMLGDKIKSALDVERIYMGQKMFANASSEE